MGGGDDGEIVDSTKGGLHKRDSAAGARGGVHDIRSVRDIADQGSHIIKAVERGVRNIRLIKGPVDPIKTKIEIELGPGLVWPRRRQGRVRIFDKKGLVERDIEIDFHLIMLTISGEEVANNAHPKGSEAAIGQIVEAAHRHQRQISNAGLNCKSAVFENDIIGARLRVLSAKAGTSGVDPGEENLVSGGALEFVQACDIAGE